MTSFQIQCFLTVGLYMNLSRAAEALFITQPAISRHISNLEKELGSQLFDRQYKPIRFTDAGRLWYQYFTRCEEEFGKTMRQTTANTRQQCEPIKISICNVWDCNDQLQKSLDSFSAAHPEQELVFAPSLPVNLTHAMSQDYGKADVLFHLEKVLRKLPDYRYFQLARIPNALFYSTRHPLAGKKDLSLADFEDSTFLYIADDDDLISNSDICQRIISVFLNIFSKAPKMQMVESSELAITMLEDGQGVMMRDEWARLRYYPQIKYITVPDEESVGLAWNTKSDNPAVYQLAREVVNYFRAAEDSAQDF
ncbi:MAG: LysR family transcriptional regulator [Oscillospiraceae bacterium]|nr:LysR family transcriptional regulator [Oscillospiraceae bacterium]